MTLPAQPSSQNFPDRAEWDRLATGAQFQDLLARKKAFILPAFLFFLVYYLLLPILVGYAPTLMSNQVFGTVTLAYLFALSQFVVGWTIAGLYLMASKKFDKIIESLLTRAKGSEGGK
ncbi:MAG: DUF485 domain-containing protein [Candidatus Sulfotelmatobacter sp.]|jgi:uncharacterized membrane protein (DUF485 family)